MKPNELRIGSWVDATTGIGDEYLPVTIVQILHDGLAINLDHKGSERVDYYMPMAGYKAIPLTEEWLKKFGAVEIYPQIRIEGLRYWQLHDICFTEDEGQFSVMIGELPGVKDITFDTVHELQNIFALTGKELQIK